MTQHAEIRAIGLENIPPDGAVFLVGNHPNSFLDFFNLAVVIRHPVATAAKDTITRLPVIGPLLRKYALLVPVSRAQDRQETGIIESERIKINKEMINEAVNLLVNGRLFNIYAEGGSKASRSLNRIKLGFIFLGIQAEKQFNYYLNLRIVPYGYYYDQINMYRSSVCVIFGKPFKVRNLIDMPEDFLSLTRKEQIELERKILLAGKRRLQSDIQDLIISITDKSLIELIDDLTEIYVATPGKYMNAYLNVREKYMLSKTLAESIQAANQTPAGQTMIQNLKEMLKDYRERMDKYKMYDPEIRREYTLASFLFTIRSIATGLVFLPFALYAYFANFIPRRVSRFFRDLATTQKGKSTVDGDEKAIIAAVVTSLIIYPLNALLIYLLCLYFALPSLHDFFITGGQPEHAELVMASPRLLALAICLFAVYLMARLWRYSSYYGLRLKTGLYYIRDSIMKIFRRKKCKEMRSLRNKIIDAADFIIGDFS